MEKRKRYRFSVYMNEDQMQQLDLLRVVVDPDKKRSRSALLSATVNWALSFLTGREVNAAEFSCTERIKQVTFDSKEKN